MVDRNAIVPPARGAAALLTSRELRRPAGQAKRRSDPFGAGQIETICPAHR